LKREERDRDVPWFWRWSLGASRDISRWSRCRRGTSLRRRGCQQGRRWPHPSGGCPWPARRRAGRSPAGRPTGSWALSGTVFKTAQSPSSFLAGSERSGRSVVVYSYRGRCRPCAPPMARAR